MAEFEERENGPLIAKDVGSMTGFDGNPIDTKPVMPLCRCGESNNKPFCDGTHRDIGFDSTSGKPAGRDRLIEYEGASATVTFNPLLCSHAGQCGKIAKHMFNTKERPWVQPDNGTIAELKAVVAACPSGALMIKGEGQTKMDRAEITVEPNGPYWVTAGSYIGEGPGEGATPEKFVLCRCGLSGNKPYCDGTHFDKKWRSDD